MHLIGDDDMPEGRRWPDAHFKFEVRDGAALCAEVHIVSKPGDRPIRSNDLQVFDLDRLAESVFMHFAYRRENDSSSVWTRHSGDTNEDALPELHRAVEAGYDDPLAELRHVARVYLDPATRSSPTNAVLTVLGYGSRATASRKVRAARERAFIPPVDATEEELDAAWDRLTREAAERAEEARTAAAQEAARKADPAGYAEWRAQEWAQRQEGRRDE